MALLTGLTIEEFEQLPDALARNHELVKGELVDVSGNIGNHNGLRDVLVEVLRPYIREHKIGRLVAEQEFEFEEDVAYGPDVSFLGPDKAKRFDGQLRVQRFVPDLAIEIASKNDKFETLHEKALYYRSRGMSVEYAFNNLLVDYPLGAGLGRWGMMRYYFGDAGKLASTEVFAEVQPNAWLLDGGLFLLVFYSLALTVTAFYDVKLLRSLASREDRLWASAVIAANFGTLALVFSFVPFGTAAGMQFWFLEGTLHGAMSRRPRLTS